MKYFNFSNVISLTIMQIAFYWEVSHKPHWSVQFINQGFKCFWAWLLHLEVSMFRVLPQFYYFQIKLFQKYYLDMVPVFPDIRSSWLVSRYSFPHLLWLYLVLIVLKIVLLLIHSSSFNINSINAKLAII